MNQMTGFLNEVYNKIGILSYFWSVVSSHLLCVQGRLFFYYSPQALGNNFFTLGKNSKFWEKIKKNKK